MSFHRERIQGAGGIAAAARPPRSAPSKIVRPRRALGDMPQPQPCRLTIDTIRMPDGSVQKVNYRSAASMPWCPGVSPPPAGTSAGALPLSVRLQAKLASAQIAPVSIGLPSAGTSPVTSPGVATTSGGGNTFTSFPNHPSPPSSTNHPSPPSSTAPSSPGQAAPTSSSTPTIVVTAPSTTNVAPARVFVTTNVPAAQATVAPSPSPYVSSPAIDLSVLTTPAPRKVPWVAIGLGVLALAILLRK